MGEETMKTKYQYMNFEKEKRKSKKRKTDIWYCLNNKSHVWLATIKWYAPWRQYCFYPEPEMIFNRGCLEDILDFIEQLRKRAHKPKQPMKGDEEDA